MSRGGRHPLLISLIYMTWEHTVLAQYRQIGKIFQRHQQYSSMMTVEHWRRKYSHCGRHKWLVFHSLARLSDYHIFLVCFFKDAKIRFSCYHIILLMAIKIHSFAEHFCLNPNLCSHCLGVSSCISWPQDSATQAAKDLLVMFGDPLTLAFIDTFPGLPQEFRTCESDIVLYGSPSRWTGRLRWDLHPFGTSALLLGTLLPSCVQIRSRH